MTFERLWDALLKRNPHLANEQETITVRVADYRAALEQAFAEGEKEERALTRMAEELFGKMQRGF